MLLRRFAALPTALFMFRLMLAGGDVACPRHDLTDTAAPVAASESSEGHHHGAESPRKDPAPEQNSVPNCCQAMATCASGAAIPSADATPPASPAHDGAFARVASLAVSRVESPDPPPPKA